MFMQIVHIQTFIYVSRVALTFNHLVPRSIILVSVSFRVTKRRDGGVKWNYSCND